MKTTPIKSLLVEADAPDLSERRQFASDKYFLYINSKIAHPNPELLNKLCEEVSESAYWNSRKLPAIVTSAAKSVILSE